MRSLATFFVALLAANTVVAQDVCRDQFVSCVQQTGDSFACRSVYTNCQANQGNDQVRQSKNATAQNDQVIMRPVITESNAALSTVRLVVSNPTAQPIQAGNATYPVTCADGSTDRAVFFMDFQIDAGVRDRPIGSDQIVCVGAGGAVSIQTDQAQIEGLSSAASQLEYEFPCSNGDSRTIRLTYHERQQIYRWENSNGYEGVLNRDFIEERQFAELACAPLKPPGINIIGIVRRQLREYLSSPPPKGEKLRVNPMANPGGVRG